MPKVSFFIDSGCCPKILDYALQHIWKTKKAREIRKQANEQRREQNREQKEKWIKKKQEQNREPKRKQKGTGAAERNRLKRNREERKLSRIERTEK